MCVRVCACVFVRACLCVRAAKGQTVRLSRNSVSVLLLVLMFMMLLSPLCLLCAVVWQQWLICQLVNIISLQKKGKKEKHICGSGGRPCRSARNTDFLKKSVYTQIYSFSWRAVWAWSCVCICVCVCVCVCVCDDKIFRPESCDTNSFGSVPPRRLQCSLKPQYETWTETCWWSEVRPAGGAAWKVMTSFRCYRLILQTQKNLRMLYTVINIISLVGKGWICRALWDDTPQSDGGCWGTNLTFELSWNLNI